MLLVWFAVGAAAAGAGYGVGWARCARRVAGHRPRTCPGAGPAPVLDASGATAPDEALAHVAGGLAHDFNNLLSIVHTHADVLLDELAPSDPLRAQAEQIRVAARRGADLTRHFVALTRHPPGAEQVVDLNAAVVGLQRMLTRVLGSDVRLVVRLSAAPRCVRADPVLVDHALVNLALNARDAMPDGGELAVETASVDGGSAEGSGHLVALSITDTGVGMDPETQARIFEPFFTTKAPGKGTGLGLTTVARLVQSCGGRLAVQSALGRGTCFRILLPAADRDAGTTRRGP
jgi:two-component system, cell cycle sensor histidine kinase and response regulator CckA